MALPLSIWRISSRYASITFLRIQKSWSASNHALPLADALVQAGLPVAEITFRTSAAPDVIRALTSERPELIVGAGTVLTVENLEAAKACGARFAVAPGFNSAMVSKARDIGIPFVPGVATPTEIEQAMALGCRLLKFFPAEALGGVKMLEALSAPYAHTGVRFVPTGGITAANTRDYLALKTVAAVGGTWIATKDHLAFGKWIDIQQRCQEAVTIAAHARA